MTAAGLVVPVLARSREARRVWKRLDFIGAPRIGVRMAALGSCGVVWGVHLGVTELLTAELIVFCRFIALNCASELTAALIVVSALMFWLLSVF